MSVDASASKKRRTSSLASSSTPASSHTHAPENGPLKRHKSEPDASTVTGDRYDVKRHTYKTHIQNNNIPTQHTSTSTTDTASHHHVRSTTRMHRSTGAEYTCITRTHAQTHTQFHLHLSAFACLTTPMKHAHAHAHAYVTPHAPIHAHAHVHRSSMCCSVHACIDACTHHRMFTCMHAICHTYARFRGMSSHVDVVFLPSPPLLQSDVTVLQYKTRAMLVRLDEKNRTISHLKTRLSSHSQRQSHLEHVIARVDAHWRAWQDDVNMIVHAYLGTSTPTAATRFPPLPNFNTGMRRRTQQSYMHACMHFQVAYVSVHACMSSTQLYQHFMCSMHVTVYVYDSCMHVLYPDLLCVRVCVFCACRCCVCVCGVCCVSCVQPLITVLPRSLLSSNSSPPHLPPPIHTQSMSNSSTTTHPSHPSSPHLLPR